MGTSLAEQITNKLWVTEAQGVGPHGAWDALAIPCGNTAARSAVLELGVRKGASSALERPGKAGKVPSPLRAGMGASGG